MRRSAAAEGDADASSSVRPLADVVARRIVIANPYFSASAAGGCASHPLGVAPHDLRIVPAHPAACVRTVLIVSRFRSPIVHHFRGRGTGSGNLKKILSVG